VEALLSAPFPYGMRAAPAGGAVAWIQNHEGVRNVWVAEPPAYQARAVTSWSADDGQELAIADWSPDGRTLLFVRGADPTGPVRFPIPPAIRRGRSRPSGGCRWRAATRCASPTPPTPPSPRTEPVSPSPGGGTSGWGRWTVGSPGWWRSSGAVPARSGGPPTGSTWPSSAAGAPTPSSGSWTWTGSPSDGSIPGWIRTAIRSGPPTGPGWPSPASPPPPSPPASPPSGGPTPGPSGWRRWPTGALHPGRSGGPGREPGAASTG
jgi:hypothetical protein